MRAWMSLVVLVSMLGVGCGDSASQASDGADASDESNGPNDSGAQDGGESPDAAPENPWQSCDREGINKEIEGYTGPKPTFSRADADRCVQLCKNQSADCYNEQNCPGLDVWETCLNRNAFACSASEGKACRAAYENVECCGVASGCTELSCVDEKCRVEATALRDCRAADKACRTSATNACFGDAAAAMSATQARPHGKDAENVLSTLVLGRQRY